MKRRRWLAPVVVLVTGMIVGAGLMAWAFPAPDRSPIRNANSVVPVTAKVEERPARQSQSLSGTLISPQVINVLPYPAVCGQPNEESDAGTGQGAKQSDGSGGADPNAAPASARGGLPAGVSQAAWLPFGRIGRPAGDSGPMATPGGSSGSQDSVSGGSVSDGSASQPSPSATSQSDGGQAGAGSEQPAGPARSVVSRVVTKPGTVVQTGDLIGEMSGSPVFAFPADVPLYRDLVAGLKGPDVEAVQRALAAQGLYAGDVTGKLGNETMASLRAMYAKAGYEMPVLDGGAVGLPLTQTACVPKLGLPISAVAKVGTVLSGEAGFVVQLQARPASVVARADILQKDAFKAGAKVSVTLGDSEPFDAKVASVSGFREESGSSPAGYDVTVGVPVSLAAHATQGTPAQISEVGDVPTAPAVPLGAIRQNGSGSYVEVAPPAGSSATARAVPVTVEAQVDGYAVLRDDDRLPIGTLVIVAQPGS